MKQVNYKLPNIALYRNDDKNILTHTHNGSRASTRDTKKTQCAEDGTLDVYKILKF
jgi:hypothetical protein